ncbi:P27 family phage terminase small subunit [Methylobacterium nodulans]|uniref:Phage terminase, small subunit, P27 family n=1 Tax=Methylobacterium nodulans (strain LMG 21967 / CNCM I-2342 / ORS 2060) TaxID=460265 RepID=B8IE32_METNO|nr:P27 family phage terminase small subunit [Methylobacterium nodulans]ACL57578.1 hypothetical protein Mnod_2615 [Methylobacterium nodulans ORS 2060]
MTLAAIPGGDGAPAEPDWSQAYADELDIAFAHEQWGHIVREMGERGTLSVSNGHAIKRLVEMRIQYERASRHVAEHGAILRATRAKTGQWNPYWSVMTKADEAIRVLEAELGLAPVRRGKAAKVERRARTARAADAYLKPVAR